MPKLTKKELDHRRRLRTEYNRQNPKKNRPGARASNQIMDERIVINHDRPFYDPTPDWLNFQGLQDNPLFDKVILGKE